MLGETIVTQSSLTEGKLRQFASSEPFAPRIPLVVDLDGTLVRTDLLIESLLALLKDKPRFVFALPFWLLKGRAAFKQEVARRISLNASLIPYRSELVEYLRTQRAKGRPVVLATANDKRLAQQVADQISRPAPAAVA